MNQSFKNSIALTLTKYTSQGNLSTKGILMIKGLKTPMLYLNKCVRNSMHKMHSNDQRIENINALP